MTLRIASWNVVQPNEAHISQDKQGPFAPISCVLRSPHYSADMKGIPREAITIPVTRKVDRRGK